ncbi:hypothetical protein WJX72_002476 [[Myrmecia] bisecta]|uniref:A-kinase anchor protein 7-like phosphoesterase domain-containing protein n=1 Tax=[Myrmecia] bisecta TaxID=41462 RepID=A0AAW1QPH2_9CHLO
MRPTHFLALRLSDKAGVAETIRTVQAALAQHDQLWGSAVVDAKKAHFTLLTLTLATPDAEERALQRMATLSTLGGLTLQLAGLNTLDEGKVLFLDVEQGRSQLMAFANSVQRHFRAAGWKPDFPFVPHVTIAKASQLNKSQKSQMPPFDVARLPSLTVPLVWIGELHLCKMSQERAPQLGFRHALVTAVWP